MKKKVEKFIAVMLFVMLMVSSVYCAEKLRNEGGDHKYGKVISFALLNSVINAPTSGGYDLGRSYSTFAVECSNAGNDTKVFSLQGHLGSRVFSNISSDRSMTTNPDTWKFDVVNRKNQWIRLRSQSGFDVTNTAICNVTAGGN